MENVSKALMMAGGLLISIMVISLIVILWGRLSSYFTENSKTTTVEQDAEFNAQFENYNKKSIRGNELISVMNKIIDYNRTASDIKNYDRIIIDINLKDKDFRYKSTGQSIFPKVFSNKGNDNDNNIKIISNLSTSLTTDTGITGIDDTKLQRLSAEIANIVDDDNADDKYKETRAKKLKNIFGRKIEDSEIPKIKEATKKYYQYTQFKRAMFKCTDVKYNQQNGRVNEMDFEIEE